MMQIQEETALTTSAFAFIPSASHHDFQFGSSHQQLWPDTVEFMAARG